MSGSRFNLSALAVRERSVTLFWGTLAYTLIGGTFGGTLMTLIFLPAMYSIWFRIRPDSGSARHRITGLEKQS